MADQTIGKHHSLEFEAVVFFVTCISCPLEYFGPTCLVNCAINKPNDVFARCSKHSECISVSLEHDWRECRNMVPLEQVGPGLVDVAGSVVNDFRDNSC